MKNLLLLLLISSCAQFSRSPVISETSQETPSWVYAPYEGCEEAAELCATGEAKSTPGADAQAKANLASVFEVKVKSDLQVSTSATQTFPWQSDVKQDVQHSIQESVDQVLEAVEIKKRFRKDGLSHSLASLDRAKATQLLGGRIEKLDHELEALWKRRQRTNLRKMVKLNLERERLNEKFSIVNGFGRPARVTFQDIVQWRESKPKSEPLALRVGQAPEWMTEKLKALLTEAGFRIVKGESAKVVSLNVESIKEFLNVQGFEKYTFTLNLTSTEDGDKKSVISTSETVTGRSQADALLKVKTYFSDYIEQHLADLNLD